MTTWNLTLTPGTAGTLESPGSMTASWGGNPPSSSNPAEIGDTLYVTFPKPSSGTPQILLNLSWASSQNDNSAVLAFLGSQDSFSDQVSWKCMVIPAAAVTSSTLTYTFRAVVVVSEPPLTEAYEIDDPEMVIGEDPN